MKRAADERLDVVVATHEPDAHAFETLPAATAGDRTTRGVALVTGGTSGIGLATARRLSSAGFTVVTTGRRHVTGEAFTSMEIDMTAPSSAEEVISTIVSRFGRLDVLVNNAGAMLVDGVIDARPADWEAMSRLNLSAATECTRAALRHLLQASRGPRGSADVVFVGSLAATTPSPGRAFYAATKAAIQAFANVLRIELASTDVRVSVVSPGLTATALRDANRPEALERMAATAGNLSNVRPLDPDDVAAAIMWIVDQPRDVSIAEAVVLPTRQGS